MAARRTPRGAAPAPEPADMPEEQAIAAEPATADSGLAKWLLYSTTIAMLIALVLVLVESSKYN